MKSILGVTVLALLFVVAGVADTLTYNPATIYVINPALTGFSTFGDQMAGMVVTAYFGSTSFSATWAATGSGAGGASVTNEFSLTESGDTFTSLWTLTNDSSARLTRLTIAAAPGNAVFDICLSPSPTCAADNSEGTPGSARGWTFDRQGGYAGTIDVTYFNEVELIGNSPVGDLWANLDLAFADAIAPGGNLTWISDTDSAPSTGSIAPVPEPMSLILLATCGAWALSRIRRRA
ncbi:MAG TPA: PEP-CTERM sorting domain-containing protein [Candidatus Acidoferrales bacterium]|nr:PEP-CTERM sorting domain-containing protein [Candidatus Acidoferrales bacterium]